MYSETPVPATVSKASPLPCPLSTVRPRRVTESIKPQPGGLGGGLKGGIAMRYSHHPTPGLALATPPEGCWCDSTTLRGN